MNTNRVALLSVAVLTAAGCGDNASSPDVEPSISTQDLTVHLAVGLDGDSNLVSVSATFFDARAPEQMVRIDADDSLSATLRGQTQPILESIPLIALPDRPPGGDGMYETFFDISTPITTSEELVVQLDRSRWESATLHVTLPGFAIEPVTSPASRASDLVVTWSPVDDNPINWVVYGDTWLISQVGEVAVPSDGTFTVPAKSIKSNGDPTVTVGAGVAMERDVELAPAAPFAGGVIRVGATARTTFTSTP